MGEAFNTRNMDGIFASTPPLDVSRGLIHEAATIRKNECMYPKVLMIKDVARAFFRALAVGQVCIELLDEDRCEADRKHDKDGHLRMSLYGT